MDKITSTPIHVNISRKRRLLNILLSGINAINPGPKCNTCNSEKKDNKLTLTCIKCSSVHHRTCLNIALKLYRELIQEPWTCDPCTQEKTTCNICQKTRKRYNNQLSCSDCQLLFHPSCIKKTFPRFKPNDFVWKCPTCTHAENDIPNTIHNDKTQDPVTLKFNGISIAHINVRDLLSTNTKDDVHRILHNYKFHILGLSETWLYEQIPDNEVHCSGYQTIRLDRPNIKSYKQRGGGLLLYVTECFSVSKVNVIHNTTVEILHVKLTKEFLKPIHVVIVYKPPTTTTSTFIDSLKKHLEISNEFETYVLGDFNINMMKFDENHKKLQSAMNDYNYVQLIKKPTRTTLTTESLLDCIFTNKPALHQISGIMPLDISDHDLVYTVRKKQKTPKFTHKFADLRCFKSTDIEKMRDMVKTAPWWIFEYCITAKEKYDILEKTINHILDIHAPVKRVRIIPNKKPWMNTEYDNLSKEAEKARKLYKFTLDKQDHIAYKKIRNRINHYKLKMKASKIKESIAEDPTGSKEAWKIVNREVGRGKAEAKIPPLRHEDQFVTDEKEKLDLLAKHFTSNPTNKTKDVYVPNSFHEHICEGACTHFDSVKVRVDDVKYVIKTLNSNKPSGLDNIPMKFFKYCIEEISPALATVIQAMLNTGYFPDQLKVAKIIPIYKQKGEKTLVNNYRPISILSSCAKIIEKIMYLHLNRYLEDNNIIMPEQHGYRRNHSTQSAVIILTDEIKKSIDQSEKVGAVFVDFQQAFDRVDHQALLLKLFNFGIRGPVLKWFQSYFTSRKIKVTKDGNLSETFNLISGCPQGSALSSVIFSLYLCDIPNELTNSKFIYYADDLALFTSASDTTEIKSKLQQDLNNLNNWCTKNNMKINVSKTKYMLFTSVRKKNEPNEFILEIDKQIVERVKSFKYLGVTLDETLNYEEHYNYVCKSMSARLYMLKRYKNYFTARWRHIFCTSLILSVLDYCLPVWGNVSQTKLERINKIIYRAAKLVVNPMTYGKCIGNDLIEHLNWLWAEERQYGYMLEFIYKNIIHVNSVTESFKYFEKRPCSKRSSRQIYDFVVPLMKREIGKSSFFYRGIIAWNSLPTSLKERRGVHFNKELRTHIILKRQPNTIYK